MSKKKDLLEEIETLKEINSHVLKARVGIKEAIKYYEKSIKDVEEKDKQVLFRSFINTLKDCLR